MSNHGHGQLLEHRTEADLTTPQTSEPAPSGAQDVDTTGIWYHLERGDRGAAEKEYRRLLRSHPGWRATDALLERLAAAEHQPAGAAARLEGWRKLSAGRARQALDAFDRALAAGADDDSRYGRVRALLALGRFDQAAGEAEKFGLTGRIAEELHGHYSLRALTEAATEPAAALASARRAADYGAAPWLALGWKLLDADHSEFAIRAFKNAERASSVDLGESLYGLALAYQHSDRAGEAVDVACANIQVDRRLGELCSGLLLDSAGSAAERGDWPAVLAATTRLRGIVVASRDAEMLRAWALYNTDRADEARDLFARLHRQDPGAETAAALLLAALKAGDKPADIGAYGAEGGDPWLRAALAQWRSDTAYARALFLAGETASPGRHKDLRGVDNSSFAADLLRRHRRGEPGEGRIDAITLALHGGLTIAGHSLTVGIDNTGFDTGGRGLVRSGDDLYEPWLAWTREGIPFTLSARLGTTPLGGAVSARPVGSLALRFDGDNFLSESRLFAESKRDSLLALAGQEDPYTGRRFGRMVESGVETSLTWFGRERMGVTAGVLGSRLSGEHVEGNRHLRLSLSASYDFPVAGFEYFRAGPYVNWQKYRENLSHYTTGHGGYYSPRRYLSTGLLLDALTDEGRFWLIGLRTGLGWAATREDASDFYPLGAPDTALAGRYAAADNSGVVLNLQVRGGLLLGNAWLLNGLVDVSRAPDYREAVLRLGLQYTFGGRAAVLRNDLPVLETYRR